MKKISSTSQIIKKGINKVISLFINSILTIKRKLIIIFTPVFFFLNKDDIGNTLFAVYDLQVSPATYDIISFLYSSEIERQKRNCKLIHLIVISGDEGGFRKGDLDNYNKYSNGSSAIALSHMEGRLHNITIPCYQLLPSIVNISYYGSRTECMYFINNIVKNKYPKKYSFFSPNSGYGFKDIFTDKNINKYNVGFAVPEYAINYVQTWLKYRTEGKKVISITLREGSYEVKRNSMVSDWIKFANNIMEKGYFVVIIRDTEKSPYPLEEDFHGISVFPEASVHLPIRMALYELSFLNLAVNGGPPMYCVCNQKIPYILFKLITGEGATTEEYFRYMGVEPGTQPSICGPNQKWVWKDDTYEVIMEEFLEMIRKIGKAK